jgi:hypothetical protein
MDEISAPPVSVDRSLGFEEHDKISFVVSASGNIIPRVRVRETSTRIGKGCVFYGHLVSSGFAVVLVVVCCSLSTFLYELKD